MILTSGRQGFVRWYPGYPSSDATHTHMQLDVAIKQEQSNAILEYLIIHMITTINANHCVSLKWNKLYIQMYVF